MDLEKERSELQVPGPAQRRCCGLEWAERADGCWVGWRRAFAVLTPFLLRQTRVTMAEEQLEMYIEAQTEASNEIARLRQLLEDNGISPD